MIYKINLDKKKEFEKWNYKQMLKHVLPLMIPILIFTDLITGLVFSSIPMPVLTICSIICFANIAGLILFFICSHLSLGNCIYFIKEFLHSERQFFKTIHVVFAKGNRLVFAMVVASCRYI